MQSDSQSYKTIKQENEQLKEQIKALKQEGRQNKAFSDAVFQSIQDGISFLNPDLTIMWVNHWSEQRYYHRMPLVGKKCYEAYHNRTAPCENCPSIKAIETGKPQSGEIRVPSSNSECQWTEISAYPYKDENGNITGVIEHVKDITDRKKMEEELRKNEEKYRLQTHRLSILLENLPGGIIVETPERKVLQVNQRFCKLFGIDAPPEALKGADCREAANQVKSLFSEEEGFIHRIDEILSHGKTVLNEELTLKDGRVFKRDYVPVDTGNGMTENVWHYRDITQSKKTENELSIAKEKAEESDRLKSAFLANMSHEIRTPMNGIMGFAQILKERELGLTERNEYLNIIYEQSEHLMQIINDIIDISKIEANQLNISKEPFNVNDLLNHLFEEQNNAREKLGKSEITLSNESPPRDLIIEGDPNRTRQVMNNLLDNALKFTDRGYIRFGYSIKAENIEFYVRDTGIGINRDKQDEVFERFRQLDESTNRSYEGTGLGLTISKHLVEIMGGSMRLESEEGKGSCFYFTLPYQATSYEKENPKETSRNEKPNWNAKTFLLVEDDPVSMEYLKEALYPTDVNILVAETGHQAMEQFNQHDSLDLILMDIKLPDFSGLEVIKEIRKIDHEIPILAQTAHAMSEDRDKCIQAGADEYISKPISMDGLLSTISKLI
jgi:PAS domain S-box-containing protein